MSGLPGAIWPPVPDVGGTALLAMLYQLERSEWLPAAELAEQQLRQLDTLRSIGLRKIGHTVEQRDTPALRGMVHTVRHLVKVEEAA